MTRQNVIVSIYGGTQLEIAGISALLSNFPGIHVTPFDKNSPPDVLIWDYEPDYLFNYSDLTARTALFILIDEPVTDLPSIECTGLFSKNESPEMLAAAIRQVARGEQYISPSLALAYLESQKSLKRETQDSPLEALSEREQEILDLLAQGQSNKSIAGRLYLSIRTVEGHIARIYAKLGVHSRTEAMLVAIESR
jgi:DNA-binding CsgD family transcriptional regulator